MLISKMRHLLKPTRTNNDMVIVTSFNSKRPSLPAKRPFGSIYQIAKAGLQQYGYYDKYKLWRYDPEALYEKHAQKYTYKPGKRVAGYLGQKIYGFPKKKRFVAASCKIHEKRSLCGEFHGNNSG